MSTSGAIEDDHLLGRNPTVSLAALYSLGRSSGLTIRRWPRLVFSSPNFLFFFLPDVLAAYYLLSSQTRNVVLLVASSAIIIEVSELEIWRLFGDRSILDAYEATLPSAPADR